MMAFDFAWSLERAHTSAGRVRCVHNDLVCTLLHRGALENFSSCLCIPTDNAGGGDLIRILTQNPTHVAHTLQCTQGLRDGVQL